MLGPQDQCHGLRFVGGDFTGAHGIRHSADRRDDIEGRLNGGQRQCDRPRLAGRPDPLQHQLSRAHVRKLYDATGGQPQRWESFGNLDVIEADAAGIAYSVERDWLIISGGFHSVSLSEAGRRRVK